MSKPDSERERVELNAEQLGWVHTYRRVDEEIARLVELRDVARDRLETALGAAELGTSGGVVCVRWTVVNASRFNQKKFKENHPDIYAAFTGPSISRRFTVEQWETTDHAS